MRHGNKINALGRKKAHREAMLANMACSLIEHKRINTTVAKAKELRKYVEPLITKSKTDSTHSRRVVFSYLKNKEAVTELFREVAPKVANRPGGYLRIIKTGRRLGDSAEMCMVELVDFNELMLKAKPAKAKRSRRGGKKKSTATPAAAAETTAKAEKSAKPEAEKPEAKSEVKEDSADNTAEAKEAKKEEAADKKAESKSEVKADESADSAKAEEKTAKAEDSDKKADDKGGTEDKEEKKDN